MEGGGRKRSGSLHDYFSKSCENPAATKKKKANENEIDEGEEAFLNTLIL